VSHLALGLAVAPAATAWDVAVHGPSGTQRTPPRDGDAAPAYRAAVDALLAAAAAGGPEHPCGLQLGASVVGVLAAVEAAVGASTGSETASETGFGTTSGTAGPAQAR
jgi:hypothetical protein